MDVGPPATSKSSGDCRPGQHLDYNLMEDTGSEPHSFNCFLILGPQKLQEDECLLFKLLSFEVISYAAIDN